MELEDWDHFQHSRSKPWKAPCQGRPPGPPGVSPSTKGWPPGPPGGKNSSEGSEGQTYPQARVHGPWPCTPDGVRHLLSLTFLTLLIHRDDMWVGLAMHVAVVNEIAQASHKVQASPRWLTWSPSQIPLRCELQGE